MRFIENSNHQWIIRNENGIEIDEELRLSVHNRLRRLMKIVFTGFFMEFDAIRVMHPFHDCNICLKSYKFLIMRGRVALDENAIKING